MVPSLFLLMFLISNVFSPVIQMYILVLVNNFFVPFNLGMYGKYAYDVSQLVLKDVQGKEYINQ